MLSTKENSTVREKRFDITSSPHRRPHHTMTDDYTLFFLHRNRERFEKGEVIPRPNWLVRLFR